MKTRERVQLDFTSSFGNVRGSTVWAALCLAACMLGLGVPATAQWSPFVTIDVTGAVATIPESINAAGAITGNWLDGNLVEHGFLRTPDGHITTFDAPGAGDASGSYEGTVPYMIDSAGVIVGYYEDASQACHGFLRAPNNTFTTIDAPGAGANCAEGEGTWAGSINPFGEINGYLVDSTLVYHAFLRSPNGRITEINVKGAGDAAGQGTFVAIDTGLNAAGTSAGAYIDSSTVYHGYVLAADGTITKFNVWGAGTGADEGTNTSGINSSGAITGLWVDAEGVEHGYARAADGAISKFDYPGAQATWGTMINDTGWIIGNYIDTNGVYHGLLRAPEGALIPIDDPSAGTASGQGTVPLNINGSGAITGYYCDAVTCHGFLRLPLP